MRRTPAILLLASACYVTSAVSPYRVAAASPAALTASFLWPDVVQDESLTYKTSVKYTGGGNQSFIGEDTATVVSRSKDALQFNDVVRMNGGQQEKTFSVDKFGVIKDLTGKEAPLACFFVYNAHLFGEPTVPLRAGSSWTVGLRENSRLGPPGAAKVSVVKTDEKQALIELAVDYAGEGDLSVPYSGGVMVAHIIGTSHTDVEFRRGILQKWHRRGKERTTHQGYSPGESYLDETVELTSDKRP